MSFIGFDNPTSRQEMRFLAGADWSAKGNLDCAPLEEMDSAGAQTEADQDRRANTRRIFVRKTSILRHMTGASGVRAPCCLSATHLTRTKFLRHFSVMIG
jgi:hypothetical protein